MRPAQPLLFGLALLLAACGSQPKSEPAPAAAAQPAKPTPPADESRRFPKPNLIETKVVNSELLGKSFMPGGSLAHYRKGRVQYDLFIARLPTATDAAVLLPDWRQAMTGAKLIPSFGGYFGQDNGRPVFVFTKNRWIAGVAGLPQKEADLQARVLASHLD